MHEVLFRKEIMCATRFRRVGSHIWEWLNETPPNEAMQYGSANEINGVATMVGKIMPVFFPDLTFFVRWVSTMCMPQTGWNPIYGCLSWLITSAISRLTGWYTHKCTTESRDKVSYSFTQGIPVYFEVPIRHIPECMLYEATGPSKWRPLTSLLVPEKW